MKQWILALFAALAVSFPATAQFSIDTSGKTPTNIEGLWWNSSQSGWGATFTQQFHITFVTIYTYDNFGNPVWYVVSNCQIVGNSCSGALFRVRSGSALTAPWNGSALAVTQVGNFSATFGDNSNATMSFTIDGVAGSKQVTRQVFNASGPSTPAPGETNRQKSERLISGTWSLTYQIISVFTDRYTFSSVIPSTAVAGDWVAVGVNTANNRLAIGSYASRQNTYSIYYQGFTIDYFYTFDFNNLNSIGGCYYQISPSGSTNLSSCYAMSGFRSPPKAFQDEVQPDGEQTRLDEVKATSVHGTPNPAVLDLYLRSRAIAQDLRTPD